MYPISTQRLAACISAVVIVVLMAHSTWEYLTHLSVDIPYTHTEVGVGRLEEGAFAPTARGIPAAGLPWTLDPIAGWSPSERARAVDACGALEVCAGRYPAWCGAAWSARGEAACAAGGGGEGALLEAGLLVAHEDRADGVEPSWSGDALVLERRQGVELVVTSAAGLQVRRAR